jgi:hypothetical protein
MTQIPAEALAKAHGPNSRRALEYSYVMKGLVEQAKQPGFTAEDWAPLAALVATDVFERIGNFKEKVTWDQYDDLLTTWGKATVWDFTVRRVTEGTNYCVLELLERATYPDRYEEYNSASFYEFDAAGKLRHLDIYLQFAEATSTSQAHAWDLVGVEAEIT